MRSRSLTWILLLVLSGGVLLGASMCQYDLEVWTNHPEAQGSLSVILFNVNGMDIPQAYPLQLEAQTLNGLTLYRAQLAGIFPGKATLALTDITDHTIATFPSFTFQGSAGTARPLTIHAPYRHADTDQALAVWALDSNGLNSATVAAGSSEMGLNLDNAPAAAWNDSTNGGLQGEWRAHHALDLDQLTAAPRAELAGAGATHLTVELYFQVKDLADAPILFTAGDFSARVTDDNHVQWQTPAGALSSATAGRMVAAGTWHHLACTFRPEDDAHSTARLYLDGGQVASRTYDSPAAALTSIFILGGDDSTRSTGLLLDEVRVYLYERPALDITYDAFIVPYDTDNDGYPNPVDNAPDTPNPDQADLDEDGIGDVTDVDDDNDGHADDTDNCPRVYNAGQQDRDGDGFGDACDTCPDADNPTQSDTDRDGVGNACDNCPYTHNPSQADSDGDGIGDACDPDNPVSALPSF